MPDSQSERRLAALRREAAQSGVVSAKGITPEGAPFPKASPETGYYGVPLLKEPQWKPEVPLYFFVGGAAGASAVIANMANWLSDDRELVRSARWIAAGGGMLSSALLIKDLGHAVAVPEHAPRLQAAKSNEHGRVDTLSFFQLLRSFCICQFDAAKTGGFYCGQDH